MSEGKKKGEEEKMGKEKGKWKGGDLKDAAFNDAVGEAKVYELQLPHRVHQHILQLHVSVDDVSRAAEVNGLDQLEEEEACGLLADAAATRRGEDDCEQVHALEVLHADEHVIGQLEGVLELDDVGVIAHTGHVLHLVLHPLREGANVCAYVLLRVLGVQQLHVNVLDGALKKEEFEKNWMRN
jgi:hypothetical protein